MTELSRRSFLRGLLTVASVSIVPIVVGGASIPRIVGDGIHDDAPGFQASLDGRPFECEGCVMRLPGALTITGGNYRLDSMVHVRDVPVWISDCRFTGNPHGSCMWYFHERPAGSPSSHLANCVFDMVEGASGSCLTFGA